MKNRWQEIVSELKLQMLPSVFNTHILQTSARLDKDTLTIYAPPMSVPWLKTRLKKTIEQTVKRNIPDVNKIIYQPQTEEVTVKLVHFNPTQRGFVMTSNYAIRFWQPYLGNTPFALWTTLRSFANNGTEPDTVHPSIQTLADMCANGNRSRILGRKECQGRKEQQGAIKVLQNANIIKVSTHGESKRKRYSFEVIATLPLLTPAQASLLSKHLQDAHERYLSQCDIEMQEWLRIPSQTLII